MRARWACRSSGQVRTRSRTALISALVISSFYHRADRYTTALAFAPDCRTPTKTEAVL
jgi:hypothetical protein